MGGGNKSIISFQRGAWRPPFDNPPFFRASPSVAYGDSSPKGGAKSRLPLWGRCHRFSDDGGGALKGVRKGVAACRWHASSDRPSRQARPGGGLLKTVEDPPKIPAGEAQRDFPAPRRQPPAYRPAGACGRRPWLGSIAAAPLFKAARRCLALCKLFVKSLTKNF